MLREDIIEFAKKEYGTTEDYPFPGNPDAVVLRHEDNQKWFGLLMYVRRSVLGLAGSNSMNDPADEYVDIINVKTEAMMLDSLYGKAGYLPAYHMNKKHWMTILLDGTVDFDEVLDHLDRSFLMTASKATKKKFDTPIHKDWLIPSNPKYFDVVTAFKENEIIHWKQSSNISVGDTIYMYVGAPYSSILYKCEAMEVDIPYDRPHPNLNIKKMMRIKLLANYDPGVFSFEYIKTHGVYAVRGPRSIPESLKNEIDHYHS